jgi:undecaprenyl-diphosphatase
MTGISKAAVRRRTFFALHLSFLLSLSPLAASAAGPPADSTQSSPAIPAEAKPRPPVPKVFTRGDLLFLGGTIAGTAVAVFNDQWLTNGAVEISDNPDQKRLAQFFQPLGRTTYLVPAAAAMYGVGRLTGHPHLARRSARTALTMMMAALVTQGIKHAVGRERPEDSPANSKSFHPFSSSSSFPSGHASTAFAAAVTLDRETSGRWVPFVVYPAATLVAWSRVHDRKHWTSDVVGGAALGGWLAWKTESFLESHSVGVPREEAGEPPARPDAKPDGSNSLLIVPEPGGMEVVVVHIF